MTAEELAGRSGVSKSTVFRYYAGKPLRANLREAIETVLREQGQSSPAPSRLTEIAVSVSPAHRTFQGYSEVIQGLIERVEPLGGQVRIVPGPAVPSARGSAGWVILGKPLIEEQADATILENEGHPFVLINRDYGTRAWSTVGISMRRGAADAVHHLLDRGHRSVGVIHHGADQHQVAREKLAGYRLAYTEAQIPVPLDLEADVRKRPLDQAMRSLIASGATACFCIDDELAFSVLRWAHQQGVSVPDRLAVMGFNDLDPSRFFSPSLSSVSVPFRRLGTAAVDALELLLADPLRQGLKLELKHEVVGRESTGPLKETL